MTMKMGLQRTSAMGLFRDGASASVGALALLLATSAAHAQQVKGAASEADTTSQDSTELEEIVVTANRRDEQSVLDVPQAVSAYSGATLDRYQVQTLQDLGKIDPSLVVLKANAAQQKLVIRGIASNVGQTAGLYLDEAPLLGGFNTNINSDGTPGVRLHDIDHVEVLKGPQGTLFGSGSMSGTVRVVQKLPSLSEFDGSLEGSYGGDVDGGHSLWDANVAMGGPVVQDKVGFRLVGWTEQDGGYIEKKVANNPTIQSDANDHHIYGVRATGLWQVSDPLSIQLTATYQDVRVNGPENVTGRVADVGLGLVPRPIGLDSKYVNYSYAAEKLRDRYQLYYAIGTYDLGFGKIITSITSGNKTVSDTEDTTAVSCQFQLCPPTFRPSAFISDQDYDYTTQELRFSSDFSGRFQVVGGVYAQQDKKRYFGHAVYVDPTSGVPLCEGFFDCRDRGLITQSTSGPAGIFGNYVIFLNSEKTRTRQYAYFAQADYKFLPNVTLTLGGRYFTAHILDAPKTGFFPLNDFVPFGPTTLDVKQNKFTYNVSLLWEATPNWSTYARVATGFRIGGVNVNAPNAAALGIPIPEQFEPDSLTNYEVGTKIYLLDHSVFLDASVYHLNWKDQQLAGNVSGLPFLLNAGLTKTNGGEVSANWTPTPGLRLGAAATYTDAKLKQDLPVEVQRSGNPGLSDDRVPSVPRWTFALRGEYEHALSGNLMAYLQGSASYRGSSFTDFRLQSPANLAAGFEKSYYERLPSYTLVDAKVGIRLDRWDVGLFVQNLTNEYAVLFQSESASRELIGTAPPRTIGLNVKTSF